MKIIETILEEVVEIVPTRHIDGRGYFSEVFRDGWFRENVADVTFVQENQSLSGAVGVVRGLHFQSSPFAQGKLVRCVSGSVFDVAVDIRKGSPNYGKWTAATLSAENCHQLWVPAGFLHGFCTLEANSIVAYKVTAYYNKSCDRGVLWNDPEIGIIWPEVADPALLSPKDAQQPLLHDLPAHF